MTLSMNFDVPETQMEQFEKWLQRVVAQEPDAYDHLLKDGYEDERQEFYDKYFTKGFSAWKALQYEYLEYA